MSARQSPAPHPINVVRTPAAPTSADGFFAPVFDVVGRVAAPAMRISMGVILLWIGLLKFHDPSPVVGLIQASFLFHPLGFSVFAYLLGALEVIAALLLFLNIGVRFVGLLVLGLFAGTLSIFLTAPMVTFGSAGFPFLSLAGQFLLKDLALASGALTLVAHDVQRRASGEDLPMRQMRAELVDLRRRVDHIQSSMERPS
jgi:uncharacterized membrane protein YkgB